jgi:hypothetical protein
VLERETCSAESFGGSNCRTTSQVKKLTLGNTRDCRGQQDPHVQLIFIALMFTPSRTQVLQVKNGDLPKQYRVSHAKRMQLRVWLGNKIYCRCQFRPIFGLNLMIMSWPYLWQAVYYRRALKITFRDIKNISLNLNIFLVIYVNMHIHV